jgi:hypothetical protein
MIEQIIAGLILSGLAANVAVLWQFNTRLSRLETKIEMLLENEDSRFD